MKKLSKTKAELKKNVAYKKACICLCSRLYAYIIEVVARKSAIKKLS